MEQVSNRAAPESCKAYDETHFGCTYFEMFGTEIGKGRRLSPHKGAGLSHAELLREFAIEQRQRLSGGRFLGPQFIVRRHGKGGIVAVRNEIAVVRISCQPIPLRRQISSLLLQTPDSRLKQGNALGYIYRGCFRH